MQKYKSNLTSVSGAAVRGASVTVLDESGALASIFLDRAGTLPAGNPLTTSQDGTFEFYAANGRYSLRTDSSGLNVLEEDVILLFDPDTSFTQEGTGAITKDSQDKLRETVSVKDFGAKLDGTNDTNAINAASNAVNDFGGGVLKWPSGVYNFAFTKPPYGVIWDMDGPDITRAQIGGLGSSVRFQKARLAYIDGPHPTSQIQTEHIRTIAKGSGAIGAPYADYTMGLTIEKENWNKPDQVQAGEIDTLTIFLRAGGPALPAADGGISGGAGILGNVGMLEGSGMVQFIEATASVFDRDNPNVINRQVNTQVIGLNPRDGTYYGAVYNNILGSQNAAMRVSGTTSNPWGRIIENQKDAIVNFVITDTGDIRWRQTATMLLGQEAVTNDLVVKNEAGNEIARFSSSLGILQHKTRTTVKNGATVALAISDLGCVVSLWHTTSMVLALPNNFPAGFKCKVLQRDAPSQVTFSPDSGAILRNVNGHTKTKAAHAICDLFVASNTSGTNAIWYLSGDTAA